MDLLTKRLFYIIVLNKLRKKFQLFLFHFITKYFVRENNLPLCPRLLGAIDATCMNEICKLFQIILAFHFA